MKPFSLIAALYGVIGQSLRGFTRQKFNKTASAAGERALKIKRIISRSAVALHKRNPTQKYLRGHDILGREIWKESRVSPSRRTPYHGRRKSIALRNVIASTGPQF